MKQQMFVENQEVDLSAELSALLTFSIDDVADFGKRSTTFSKTIVLPGTNRNNKVFGGIFEIGRGNEYDPALPNYGYNYNASKSATCIIFQDNIQTFKGVIRLTQINKDGNRVEYETVVFGDLFLLNTRLSSALIGDLDFSEYDHVFDETAVVDSWDNPGGSGYYYPLIDCGTYSANKHDWDIRTFKPALYVKEYIDKIFDGAEFNYSSALFDTQRFKNLIIPHNQKVLQILRSDILSAKITSSHTLIDTDHGVELNLTWDTVDTTAFTYTPANSLVYIAPDSITANIKLWLDGTRQTFSGFPASFKISVLKNGIEIQSQTFFTPPTGIQGYDWRIDFSTNLTTGDYLEIQYRYLTGSRLVVTVDNPSISPLSFIEISSDKPIYVPVGLGDTVTLNTAMPKNVRQIDFLVSIVELFNLYVYEDRYDNKLIHIEPYVDFFDVSGTVNDWTYKMNRAKTIKVKPMSELNSKLYKYNYKLDSDYYNDLYNKRYGQGYGSYIFDTLYEFASQENKLELIFAATPLVGYAGEDKVYSTIFKRTGPDTAAVEEKTDSIIRILQAKKITGVTNWNILDGVTVLDTQSNYGYAGHFDDPDAPTNDLNFGALQELFFTLVSGTLSNTQFNLYWSSYMAEITDKDSKLLSAYFYLKTIDIYNLDFSKYITVDGVLFRLNKITDYNMNEPMDCEVELLKVNYKVY